MSISLGVHVGQQNMTMDEMRALWRKLDQQGVDWISAWDHFYEAPPKGGTEPHFEALTTLGALAAETRHARIGCLVFYVGYRNPALLAKAATTLDHITGGRFELGIGAGWHIWEATAYGYPFPDIGTRLDMLEEAAQIIRRMLTEERTSFSGVHYQVDDASCLPHPVQERLPIWIGGEAHPEDRGRSRGRLERRLPVSGRVRPRQRGAQRLVRGGAAGSPIAQARGQRHVQSRPLRAGRL